MPRRFGQVSIYRVLVGAEQSEVRAAVSRWLQKDKQNTSFDIFIFALRVTHNVVTLIPWVRKVSSLLGFFLDLMDVLIEIYTFTYPQLPPPVGTRWPERDKLDLLDQVDRERLILSAQAFLDSLVAK